MKSLVKTRNWAAGNLTLIRAAEEELIRNKVGTSFIRSQKTI